MTFLPGTPARAVDTRGIRTAAAAAAIVTVGAGLGLRAIAAGSAAKYGGDALYTVLVLALVVLAAPRLAPLKAAATALAFSCGVEFLQLSYVPAELSRRSTIARLVLGSTFNAPDLLWYAVGAAAGCLAHTAVRALLSRSRAPLTPRPTPSRPGGQPG